MVGGMKRTIGKLTAMAVQRAKAKDFRTGHGGLLSDGGGLYLSIGENDNKSWIYRYKRPGKQTSTDHGLGSYPDVSLAEARELATECRRMRRNGIDPIDSRRAARAQEKLETAKMMTFRQCGDAYIESHKAGWRNPKHAAQWPATLEAYAYPIFGSLPAQAVDIGLVMKVIEPMWQTKTETASRLRGRIESILDWATTRGYRQGENPARWRGHLENLLPKKSRVRRVEHHAALPYTELGGFMAALRGQDGIVARALEFTILTASRAGEAISARWSEVNLTERIWVVPAERMKAGREHRVPLSDRVIEILDDMARVGENEFVFPGARKRRPISAASFFKLLRRMGRGDLHTHGFRSVFSDWCSERTNFPAEVREMALAHAVGDKVEAAYRRGDLFQKRRQLMDAWARVCSAPATDKTDTVVPLAAAR
jgi:integrase